MTKPVLSVSSKQFRRQTQSRGHATENLSISATQPGIIIIIIIIIVIITVLSYLLPGLQQAGVARH